MLRNAREGFKMALGYKNINIVPYACSTQTVSKFSTIKPVDKVQSLPHLPVPKLNDTLNKYLKSVRPHLNDHEFAVTSNLVKDFVTEGGVGQKLQSLLEKRAQEHINWLEDWWLNSAYLDFRSPVVVYSNPGLVFPMRKFQTEDDQLQYAAKTLLAVLDYKQLIDSDGIPTEMMGKNPLDMSQYKKIFGTCRIPGLKRDSLSYSNSKYFTVIHNNHIFHMDLWGEDDIILNEDQIVNNLKHIIKESGSPAANSIGILTSENRDAWGQAYDSLVKDNVNKESLTDIHNSLAVLCLDKRVGLWNSNSKDDQQNIAAAQTIHGGGYRSNGANRWFDKTVQFIVGGDGVTGLTYEHSPAEGQPIAVMTDFIINSIDKNKTVGRNPSTSPKKPFVLNFTPGSDVQKAIKTAEKNLDKLVVDLDLNCFTYTKYGKNFIKSQKFSPDSYLQMAMQYAFYRLEKIPGAHYESAATRMYIGGRTETIRSCSIQSVHFAQTMLNQKCSPKEKVAALTGAIQAHKDYTVQALQGLGVDRHLLGLKLLAIENGIEVPKLYSDPGYVKSAHMRISTSQVACKCDAFMCYGPLVPDGYATCYNPRDNDVNFATSAFTSNSGTNCTKYRNALEQSLQDMHDVLLQNTKSKL